MGTLIKAGKDSLLPQLIAQEHLQLSCEIVKVYALDKANIASTSDEESTLYGEAADGKMRFKNAIKIYGAVQDLDWSWESNEPGLKGEKVAVCFFAKKDFDDNGYEKPKKGDIVEAIGVKYIILRVSTDSSRFGNIEAHALYECSMKRITASPPEGLHE